MLELRKRPLLVDPVLGQLKGVEPDVSGHASLFDVVLRALQVEDAHEHDHLDDCQPRRIGNGLEEVLRRRVAKPRKHAEFLPDGAHNTEHGDAAVLEFRPAELLEVTLRNVFLVDST